MGEDEVAIGYLSEVECGKRCAQRAFSNPSANINGATIRKSDGRCWCEIGMKRQDKDTTYNSCFFLQGHINNTLKGSSVKYD